MDVLRISMNLNTLRKKEMGGSRRGPARAFPVRAGLVPVERTTLTVIAPPAPGRWRRLTIIHMAVQEKPRPAPEGEARGQGEGSVPWSR